MPRIKQVKLVLITAAFLLVAVAAVLIWGFPGVLGSSALEAGGGVIGSDAPSSPPLSLLLTYVGYSLLFTLPAWLAFRGPRWAAILVTILLISPAIVTFFFGWALVGPGLLVLIASVLPREDIEG